ncbi:MAG: hypothetical protein ABIK13_02755 [Patescibacteria group bacterium]
MTHVLLALVSGAISGAMLLALSHLAPTFGAGSMVRDIDRPVLLGRSVTRRASHVMGMAVYLALCAVFGAAFAVFVDLGVISGYGMIPIFAWGAVFACLHGLIILPLEGHGLFGMKEDAWFPIDLVVMSLLWAVVFWWLMQLWSGIVSFS